MIVKVCGITRREDALAAADAGADAIGFIFYKPSPRYITPEKARDIGDALPVWKVGVFVDESPADVADVMRSAKLDVAQIYGGASPEGFRVWRAVRVSTVLTEPVGPVSPPASRFPNRLLETDQNKPAGRPARRIESGPTLREGEVERRDLYEALFLDSAGNGISFDWRIARGAAEKVIIAGGLDASNVAEAIRAAAPWGVDASSRLESTPGVKDHEKMRRFVQAARGTSI